MSQCDYTRLKEATDRLAGLMGWEPGEHHKYEVLRAVGRGDAVALSLDKAHEIADRIERHDKAIRKNGGVILCQRCAGLCRPNEEWDAFHYGINGRCAACGEKRLCAMMLDKAGE
jgi:hypothetical protein